MIVFSYILGSIPTSIIVARRLRGIDIREYGSGNAGGTNTVRILGWMPGMVVMTVDVLKGALAVLWIAPLAFGALPVAPETFRIAAAAAAVTGHIWTVFAGFRGGKGVGTGAGALAVLSPGAFAVAALVFLAVFALTRTVFLGSLAAALSLPIVLTVFRNVFRWSVSDALYIFGFCAAGLIFYTHRTNIARYRARTKS